MTRTRIIRPLLLYCGLCLICHVSAPASSTISASDEALAKAWNFAGRNATVLREKGIHFTIEAAHTQFGEFLDERELGKVTVDHDFTVDHQSFIVAAKRMSSATVNHAVEIICVTGKFTEDEQAEQRTPAFWITWVCRIEGTNSEFKMQGFAFGPRYNNLLGSAEKRRRKMLESATIAYTAATYVVLAKLDAAITK